MHEPRSTPIPHGSPGNDPRTHVGFGVGAFNVLRRGAYEAIGTHATPALRPDDDVQFVRRVKRLGLSQQLLSGADLLRVEWYPSPRAAIRGFEKNSFAGFDYSVPLVVGQVGASVAMLLWTYVGAWRAAGDTRWLQLGTVAVQAATTCTPIGACTGGSTATPWRRAPRSRSAPR